MLLDRAHLHFRISALASSVTEQGGILLNTIMATTAACHCDPCYFPDIPAAKFFAAAATAADAAGGVPTTATATFTATAT